MEKIKTLTITEDGTQTIYHGPLNTYRPTNDFISNLVQSAIDDGEASMTDYQGCEVTVYID